MTVERPWPRRQGARLPRAGWGRGGGRRGTSPGACPTPPAGTQRRWPAGQSGGPGTAAAGARSTHPITGRFALLYFMSKKS